MFRYNQQTTPPFKLPSTQLQALLAMVRGVQATQVSGQFGIPRSDLYKFRKRALAAMREALVDHPRGPKLGAQSSERRERREDRVFVRAICHAEVLRSSEAAGRSATRSTYDCGISPIAVMMESGEMGVA
jgi:hypothetical protein